MRIPDQQFLAPTSLYAQLIPNLGVFKLEEVDDMIPRSVTHSIQDLPSATATPLLFPFDDEGMKRDGNGDADNLVIFESDEEEPKQECFSDVLPEEARTRTLYALELIALCFLRQVACDHIEITLVSRSKVPEENGPSPHRTMHWPKRIKNGSFRRFACLFRVIDLICEALTNDVPTTKREIFYQDVPLFKTQAVVDDLVDDLAATIGATRADLNVRASAKGLFCGSGLKIHLKRGGVIHGNSAEGALVPASAEISYLEVSESLSWVLIVEKEAIFQTLCRVNFSSNPLCPGPGIIITGKGYPDLATRELVCQLSHKLSASIPILAVVDADPHGLEILSVFKYGSQRLSHEGSKAMTPRIEWLGLCGSELSRLGVDRDKLLPLTKHDRKKALCMLRRDDAIMPTQWRRELSRMLHSRHKAEIEILSSASLIARRNSPQQFLHQTMFQRDDNPPEEVPLVQYLASRLHSWVTRPIRIH